jgi:hypothetical protein
MDVAPKVRENSGAGAENVFQYTGRRVYCKRFHYRVLFNLLGRGTDPENHWVREAYL